MFGGQEITGRHAGAPVDVIQSVDPARHTAAVIGHLPEPLAGAMAMTLDHELFVAGGDSPAARRPIPGAGTTRFGPATKGPGTGPPAESGSSSSRTSTVSTIWTFDPEARRLLIAGRLQVPVSHAGVAVTGSVGWIVGGESGGALTTAVQMLRPGRGLGRAGAPGAGRERGAGQGVGVRGRCQRVPFHW